LKTIFAIPVVVTAVFAVSVVLLRYDGSNIQWADPIVAGVIAVIAAELALAPAMAVRNVDQMAATRAGLIGVGLHLLVNIVLVALALLGKLVQPHGPFVFWLLGGFSISLLIVAWTLSSWIRSAPQVVGRANPNVVKASGGAGV
jgi:hypothetical protein